jgi:hypothetical protein
MTTQVQLDGDGPFLTPTVVGFPGLAAGPRQDKVRIQFVLADGRLLLVPIQELAFQRLCRQFADMLDKNDPH